MRKVDVEITEDVSRSDGGYAIVLLKGVASLPDKASFRIKPVDTRDPFSGPGEETWPRGEHVPVAVRQTDAGVELVIGPDIVECPALLPGTVGVIEVAAANVRGEFLWPSIRPTARPRRKHLSIVKPQRGAQPRSMPASGIEPHVVQAGVAAGASQSSLAAAFAPAKVAGSRADATLGDDVLAASASGQSAAVRAAAEMVRSAPSADIAVALQPSNTLIATAGSGATAAADDLMPDRSSSPPPSSSAASLPTSRQPASARERGLSSLSGSRWNVPPATPSPPTQSPAISAPGSDIDTGSQAIARSPDATAEANAVAAAGEPSLITVATTTSPTIDSTLPIHDEPASTDADVDVDVDLRETNGHASRPAGERSWGAWASGRIALIAASGAFVLLGGYAVSGLLSSEGRDTSAVAQARPASGGSAGGLVDRAPKQVAQTTVGRTADNAAPAADAGMAMAETIGQHTEKLAQQAASNAASQGGLGPVASPVASPVAGPVAGPVAIPVAIPVANPAANPVSSPIARAASAVLKEQSAEDASKSEVTLRIRGGGFQVSGELRGFDGAKYVIATKSSGVMTMDASRFECQGEACSRPPAAILPQTERPNPLKPDHITIDLAPTFGSGVMAQLIKSYAASIAATAAEIPGSREATTMYRISDTRGAELATIEITANPATAALNALEQGNTVMAFTERAGAGDDVRPAGPAVGKRVSPITEQLIGFDGVAAVVAPQRTIASLSVETLAKVFSGQITDWFELGATPGPISLYLAAETNGTVEAFNALVMKPRGLKLSSAISHLRGDGDVAAAVAGDRQGLGLVSFTSIGATKALNIETQCGLITRPTGFGLKTEEYPLARRLYLSSVATPAQPSARSLIRLAHSSDVQRAMSAGGLVDLSMTTISLADHSERMASAINAPAAAFDLAEMRQMLTDLAGYNRLSISLRFNSAGELDGKSRKELARLGIALKEAEFAGKRILLAGFTDAAGKFQANLTVGLKRAGQVRTALLAAAGAGLDPRLVSTKGYGALAPVACNTTADGQRLNRRVEVWIADDTPARNAAR